MVDHQQIRAVHATHDAITLFRMRWEMAGKNGFSKPHHELLEAVWEDYQALFPGVDMNVNGQVMLFRFGYGKPIRHGTHRKKMETFLGEG